MAKEIMFEKEMERYQERELNLKIRDEEGTVDSVLVSDNAISLGYDAYIMEGNGILNQTNIFILSRDITRHYDINIEEGKWTSYTPKFKSNVSRIWVYDRPDVSLGEIEVATPEGFRKHSYSEFDSILIQVYEEREL